MGKGRKTVVDKLPHGQPTPDRAARGHRAALTTDALPPVIGMGASAGGLEAFQRFFANMPPHPGVAFVIVQHLDPDHESLMSQLIGRSTEMTVLQAEDGMRIEADHIYIIPPNRYMAVTDGSLRLTVPTEHRGMRLPIDFLFRSLAESRKEHAVCIVLSGTGSDGTAALRAVNAAGGIAMVQDPATAKYDGMPRSAVESGYADYVLPPERMPEQLLSYVKSFGGVRTRETPALPERLEALWKILRLLRVKTGHDFSFYKKNTIFRRIERRMNLLDITDMALYSRYLQERPGEVERLFKEILIRVTSFFRDPEAFDALKAKVMPLLLDGKKEGYPFRAWVPGCASGEEVYSIAILVSEFMEETKRDFTVQIFGTDIDQEAITMARTGLYPPGIASSLSPERLKRFFREDEGQFRVAKQIRESVVFAIQDVAKDPPFTRLDLISCRNLLIYLEGELQNRILSLLHYSLKPGGVLMLGTSETIGPFADLFTPVDKKWRLFQAKPTAFAQGAPGLPDLAAGPDESPDLEPPGVKKTRGLTVNPAALFQKVLLDRFAPPAVMVDSKGRILYFYGDTGQYLKPPQGQPVLSLVEMAREGLGHELVAGLRTAGMEGTEVVRPGLNVRTNGGFARVDLIVRPLHTEEGGEALFMIMFEKGQPEGKDKAEKPARRGQGSRRTNELQSELKYTRESLQATIEELQASNEELKSTNEELQSTNEELQSANEEMETSKEELQSVNEELITVNTELYSKMEQLSQTDAVMKNLLENTNVGSIFLDNQLHLLRFTSEAAKLINLIASDAGRPLAHIVSNLLREDLVADAGVVLETLQPLEKEVESKDGGWYLVRVMPYRALRQEVTGVVITFTDITAIKRLAREQEAARAYAESVVDTVREPLIVLDASLRVISANRSFYGTFEVSPEETEHRYLYDLGNGQWDIPELKRLLGDVTGEGKTFRDFRVEHQFPTLGRKVMLINGRSILRDGKPYQILLAIEDVTEAESGPPKHRRRGEGSR